MPVIGNGNVLGVYGKTNGNVYALNMSSWADRAFGTGTIVPPGGLAVGTSSDFVGPDFMNINCGVTTDPTKSGIVANLSNIDIGEVNSVKLGKYILKY